MNISSDSSTNASVTLTIMIACKNEEANIVGTLNAVAASMQQLDISYEVLVIDDGSTDRTSEVAEQYRTTHPDLPIQIHQNQRNRGLSRTYVDGAFLGRGKYYRQVNGDNVEPAETLVTIFNMIGHADMIIPYYPHLPGKSPVRLAVSALYTFLVNLLSGNSIQYYNGGAVHLRYNVLRWHPYSFGFGFQADFITRLIQEGATYLEVPVQGSHTNKGPGGSPFHIRNFVSTAHTLFEIFRRRLNVMIFGE
jgi:glycosyltransferase involved in cell wall biosynthesis